MPRTSHTADVLHGWKSILGFGVLGLALALGLSFTQPLEYSSTVKLLILQSESGAVDAYTAGRSEERIADDLSTLIYTTTFFDDVMSSGFSIDPKSFPAADYARRRAWQQSVSTSVSSGTGFLTITTYHPDVAQAEQLARAIAFVLTKNVNQYTPGGNVEVQLIDAPLNSRWPVKPDLITNGLSGLFLGGLIGALYVLIRAERLRRRHQLPHEAE